MSSSIISALGAGSGIDVSALVTQLADAQRASAEAAIIKREEAISARISALAEVGSAIDSFAAALSTLISGGSLSSKPVVSDERYAVASAPAGTELSDLSAEIEVVQIARAQVAHSAPLPAATSAVGQGEISFATGSGGFTVTINEANDSLSGLAATINAAKGGVTASIVTDSGGARLVLRGSTGADAAFTVTADPPGGDLARFASAGLTQTQAAADAVIRVDGVEARSATNRGTGLVGGVTIDVVAPTGGSSITLSVSRPVEALRGAVEDFVAAYNELRASISAATANRAGESMGPARGETAITELARRLAQLPTMRLSSREGSVQTLAELGVRTARDGTLSIDSARLSAALAADPVGVEALFTGAQHSSSALVSVRSGVGRVAAGTYSVTGIVPAGEGVSASGFIDGIAMQSSGSNLVAPASSLAAGLILAISGNPGSATITIDPGLGGALQSIRDALRSRGGAFAGAQDRLDREAKRVADDREVLERRSAAYSAQLLTSFSAMDRRVSSFQSTRSFLEQQIALWTSDQ